MVAWWSYPTNITGIGDYITWMHTISGNILGDAILIATFLISFIALNSGMTEKPEKAIAASGFLSSIIGVLLFRMGIVHIILVYVCMFLTVIGFIWSFSRRDGAGNI